MDVQWELEIQVHASLTSALDGVMWLVSQTLFTRKESGYPMDVRLGGIQSRSGQVGEDKNSLPLT